MNSNGVPKEKCPNPWQAQQVVGHYSDDGTLHNPRYQPELRNGDTHALESCRVEVKTGAGQDDHQSYLPVNR